MDELELNEEMELENDGMEEEEEEEEEDSDEGIEDYESDEEENVAEAEPVLKPGLGCEHYRRKCQLVCPDPSCDKVFTCRFCHDEVVTEHTLDRFAVKEVVCMNCKERQAVGNTCVKCDTVFGKYHCDVCNLYNDEDKQTFHCTGCGICRVGPRENFFHCGTCDMCFPVKLEGKHKCVEKASRADCAVCLEDIHSARCPSHIPPCGHLIHQPCFEQLLKKAMYTCPQCNASMVDMERVWKHLDEQIQISPLPAEYANKNVYILCRDCNQFSTVLFHFIGVKCGRCESYNTSIESGPNLDMPDNDESEVVPIPLVADSHDVFEDAEEVDLEEVAQNYAEFVDANDDPSADGQMNEFYEASEAPLAATSSEDENGTTE